MQQKKKIVALVLCLALALSLCTVAFAADDEFDLYPATSEYLKDGAVKAVKVDTYLPLGNKTLTEVAGKTNADGSGSVAYLDFEQTEKFVKTSTPTVSDYAVTKDGKTEVLYYVTKITKTAYSVVASEFTSFGTTTGMVYSPVAGATYYKDADGVVYTTATTGLATKDVLVGNVVKTLNVVDEQSTLTAGTVVEANYVVTATKASTTAGKLVPTEVTDTNSGVKYTALYKAAKAPAGSKVLATFAAGATYDADYVLVKAAGTTAGDKTVESAKTFDAGIALYAGMALASVAGSAVVIGKKKEF